LRQGPVAQVCVRTVAVAQKDVVPVVHLRHVHLPSSNCVTVAEGLPLQFYARNHGRTQLSAAAHKKTDISQLRGRGAAAVLAVVWVDLRVAIEVSAA
jgi:hypothetical protein